jgi:3-oxoacyl-[acyl-carrier-protein] synthase-3
MKYTNVHLESLGYELPPLVVTTAELENRIAPVYDALRIAPGQIEALTGIVERRWWDEGFPVSQGALAAARKALARSNVRADEVEAVVYAGVCRENFEPATACLVASGLGVSPDALVYDISNACLGVLNGILEVANRIELGQIRAGLVVSCESSRDINEAMIGEMNRTPTMDVFTRSLATLTGGSGAAAVLLTDGSFGADTSRRLLGAVTKAAPEHHRLCRWGVTWSPVELTRLIFSPVRLMAMLQHLMDPDTIPTAIKKLMTHERLPSAVTKVMPSEKLPAALTQFMSTDSVAVLKHGVELGVRTWSSFLKKLGWADQEIDKVICHQVGSGHRDTILKELGIPLEKDFSTYTHLGNMGTVSLPLTAALADQRKFLKPRDRVGFLGIGSGLNCMMLGWEW